MPTTLDLELQVPIYTPEVARKLGYTEDEIAEMFQVQIRSDKIDSHVEWPRQNMGKSSQ